MSYTWSTDVTWNTYPYNTIIGDFKIQPTSLSHKFKSFHIGLLHCSIVQICMEW